MLDWALIDIFQNHIRYNNTIRHFNPNISVYVTKTSLSTWDNGVWVKMYQLEVL